MCVYVCVWGEGGVLCERVGLVILVCVCPVSLPSLSLSVTLGLHLVISQAARPSCLSVPPPAPQKEPFLSPCDGPSLCPSTFSRLASVWVIFCVRCPSYAPYQVSIHSLLITQSRKGLWMLEVLLSFQLFPSRWASPSALHISFHRLSIHYFHSSD